MRIIIDFDYTVFDTHALRRRLLECLVGFGITQTEYQAAEQQATLGVAAPFMLERFLEALFPDAEQRLQAAQAVEIALRDLSMCVYPDVVPFFQRHATAHRTILSFGDPTWIRKKIAASGISSMVQEVVAVDQPKDQVITLWPVVPETIVVNDRGSEIDAMYAVRPDITYIHVQRPGTPYLQEPCEHARATFPDLTFTLPIQ